MSQATSAPVVSDRGDSDSASGLSVTRQISYWRLIYLRFLRNRLAVVSLIVLIITYTATLAAEFVAPYSSQTRFLEAITAPPQLPKFIDINGRFHLVPFVYALKLERDPRSLARIYTLDTETIYPFSFFVHGEPYEFLFFKSDRHLFGVTGTDYFLLGTDTQGRDLFSRIIYGGRVSTTIGLIGVVLSLVFGFVIGMISGYLGGHVDQFIQRAIEVLLSFPTIPLWLALSAALPRHWSPLRVFFVITIILSIIGWGSLARIVRGMVLSLKNEEYILAAQMSGGGTGWIIRRHLFSGVFSYLIVVATLMVPAMILAETALSFLGLGIRPPVVSWGTLLQDAQDVTVISQFPWLITPVFCVIVTVLAFNFIGDGLRDAVDPHSRH